MTNNPNKHPPKPLPLPLLGELEPELESMYSRKLNTSSQSSKRIIAESRPNAV